MSTLENRATNGYAREMLQRVHFALERANVGQQRLDVSIDLFVDALRLLELLTQTQDNISVDDLLATVIYCKQW